MRSTSRVADVSINTVYKLLAEAGLGLRSVPRCDRARRREQARAVRRGVVFLLRQTEECRDREDRTRGRRRRLDMDGTRRRLEADPLMGGRRARCGLRFRANGRSSRPAREPGPAHHGRPQGLFAGRRGSLRGRYRLWHVGEALRGRDGRTRARAEIQPLGMSARARIQSPATPIPSTSRRATPSGTISPCG
jgi:hypothetical protein